MSEILKTVRVLSTHPKTQGDFVEINETDYDEKVHKLYKGKIPTSPPPAANLKTPAPQFDGLKFASDEARKKAIESGLDFSKVVGTGRGKVITNIDVDKVVADAAPKTLFADDAASELANDMGIDATQLATITGTGDNGAVNVADLEKFAEAEGDTE